MRVNISLFLFALLLLGGTGAYGAPVLLDGTAATVGKVLLTVQDAHFYRALLKFKDGEANPLKPEAGEDLKKTVQKMVFEEMVYAEMKSLQFEAGPRSEAEKMLGTEKAKKGKDVIWREILRYFGKSESVAVDRLWKSLQVERFIQKKIETLTPIITDGEAERYYRQNQARFQGSRYEALKPNIVLLLKKQRMQNGLEEWVKFLKDKYSVTNLLDG